jgi:hypothetical protein
MHRVKCIQVETLMFWLSKMKKAYGKDKEKNYTNACFSGR